MSDAETPWYAEVITPALLGAARRGYVKRVRAALEAAGFDDMPRLGTRLVGGIALNGPAGPNVARQLGLGEERAQRLVDVLVERQYVELETTSSNEPRYVLTDRGRAAAGVMAEAREAFEQQVIGRVGNDDLMTTRAVLGAMIALADEHSESG
jgi:DNA-binding MarR family transcriptional regulator